MPFCPKCKNEYREGFTHCAECKFELVDSLEDLLEDNQDENPNAADEYVVIEEESWEKFTEEDDADQSEKKERPKDGYQSGIYRNSAERAEDNKSSAWTLLSV